MLHKAIWKAESHLKVDEISGEAWPLHLYRLQNEYAHTCLKQTHTHTHTHMWLAQTEAITYSGNVSSVLLRDVWMCKYLCGVFNIQIQQSISPQQWIQSSLPLLNTTVGLLLFSPVLASILYASPLLSGSISPLIYQAHISQTAPAVYFKFLSVNPNCTLCLSRVSPNQNYEKCIRLCSLLLPSASSVFVMNSTNVSRWSLFCWLGFLKIK